MESSRRNGIPAEVFLCGLGLAAMLGSCAPAVPTTPSATVPLSASATPAPTSSPTTRPSATSSATAAPTATVGPTPPGGAAELVFGLAERVPGGYSYGPIVRFQVVEGRSTLVTREGFEFLGMSPSGDRLLARRDASLVLLDLEGREVALVTDQLLNASLPAVWIPETQQVAYLEDVEGDRLHIFDLKAGSAKSQPGTRNAQSLLPPSGPKTIVWLGQACEPEASCRNAWWLDPTTGGQTSLTGWVRPIPDPSAEYVAYLYADDSGKNRLALAPIDRSREVHPGVPGDNILDYVWSPDGARLLVVALVRSDYSGRWFGSRQFLITPGTWEIRELPQTNTANALGLWSPDGRQVILAGTQPDGDGYDITLRRIDLTTRKVETLAPGIDLSSPNFVFVTEMAWRPVR
ncbi:MAG TPA: hypothetical protein VLD63_15255 [Anaerolineales bacterium]|nr:hypothetical protein [Anaerolineales bacterium]